MSSSIINLKHKSFKATYYGYSMYNRFREAITYYGGMYHNSEASKVDDKLWIGNISPSCNKKFLNDNNITHIVSVLAGYNPIYPQEFNYLVINSLDSVNADLASSFDQCFDFINNADGNVLIHCMSGKSRSVTVGMMYLIRKYGLSIDDALKNIRETIPNANPNPGFIEQLNEYLDKRNVHNVNVINENNDIHTIDNPGKTRRKSKKEKKRKILFQKKSKNEHKKRKRMVKNQFKSYLR